MLIGAAFCRSLQDGADCCSSVQGSAGWCSFVQIGLVWCRSFQVDADLHVGAGCCRLLVQVVADLCRLLQIGVAMLWIDVTLR